jgi:hypothetical protein
VKTFRVFQRFLKGLQRMPQATRGFQKLTETTRNFKGLPEDVRGCPRITHAAVAAKGDQRFPELAEKMHSIG